MAALHGRKYAENSVSETNREQRFQRADAFTGSDVNARKVGILFLFLSGIPLQSPGMMDRYFLYAALPWPLSAVPAPRASPGQSP